MHSPRQLSPASSLDSPGSGLRALQLVLLREGLWPLRWEASSLGWGVSLLCCAHFPLSRGPGGSPWASTSFGGWSDIHSPPASFLLLPPPPAPASKVAALDLPGALPAVSCPPPPLLPLLHCSPLPAGPQAEGRG